MANTYLTKEGDMVDEICWRYYAKGQQALGVEYVYQTNRRLAQYGPKLPAGISITLPSLPTPRTTPIVNLWGSS